MYAVLGSGISNSGVANGDIYGEEDWYGSTDGILNTTFRSTDGTFDYAAITNINRTSTDGSQLIMTNLETRNVQYGVLSTYSNQITSKWKILGGVDVRYFIGSHTNRISDLFGGSYYIDPERNNVSIENNSRATEDWMSQKLYVGDVVHRDYDSHIAQGGVFSELNYSTGRYNILLSGTLNYSNYWRYDRLYYDLEHAHSENIGFWNGYVKSGVNMKLFKHSNAFINGGYISRSPIFKSGIFMSANTSNIINQNAVNEKALLAEIGYGFHNKGIDLNVNGYYIKWIDKSMTKKGKMVNKEQYYINMVGVDATHIGLEFEMEAHPLKWLDIDAMLSIGNWTWDNNCVKGYAYSIYGQALTPDGEVTAPGSSNHAWATIDMKGVHVGGSAQTTAMLGFVFKPVQSAKIGLIYTLYDRNYAYYSLSGSNLSLGNKVHISEAWEIPISNFLDIYASYRIKLSSKVYAVIVGNVNNILNQHYIEKAWNPYNIGTDVTEVNANDVYFFYSFGRTWSIKLKIEF